MKTLTQVVLVELTTRAAENIKTHKNNDKPGLSLIRSPIIGPEF